MPTVKHSEIKLDHQILELTPFKTRQTSTSWSGVGEAAAAGTDKGCIFSRGIRFDEPLPVSV